MITEFFIWIMAQTSALLFALFPAGPDSEPVADGVQSGIGTVMGYAAGFGSWIPWSVVGPALLLCIGSLVAAGGIRLVRIVASFLTMGGGSAA